jgi:hypothetical protein
MVCFRYTSVNTLHKGDKVQVVVLVVIIIILTIRGKVISAEASPLLGHDAASYPGRTEASNTAKKTSKPKSDFSFVFVTSYLMMRMMVNDSNNNCEEKIEIATLVKTCLPKYCLLTSWTEFSLNPGFRNTNSAKRHLIQDAAHIQKGSTVKQP